ncbi:MAG TPA: hypothetical protein VF494_07350 [Candidatus Limnocylindrales bacterium]
MMSEVRIESGIEMQTISVLRQLDVILIHQHDAGVAHHRSGSVLDSARDDLRVCRASGHGQEDHGGRGRREARSWHIHLR